MRVVRIVYYRNVDRGHVVALVTQLEEPVALQAIMGEESFG